MNSPRPIGHVEAWEIRNHQTSQANLALEWERQHQQANAALERGDVSPDEWREWRHSINAEMKDRYQRAERRARHLGIEEE